MEMVVMKRTALMFWFLAVAVLLAANSYVSFVNVRKLINYSQEVAHSRDVIFMLDRMVAGLINSETGERGYLITGEESYLKPYRDAVAVVRDTEQALDDLVDSESPQQARVRALRVVADEKLVMLASVIELRDTRGFDAARLAILFGLGGTPEKPARTGKQMMDEARAIADAIRTAEEQELASKSQERMAASDSAMFTLAGSGILNVSLLLGLWYAVRRDMKARAATNAERERSAAIAVESEERRRTAEALSLLNQRLEVSNRELQDFAYVASHDLQEPLRKIQAFGDRLMTRFSEVLAQDGRDYLERMHSAASRMQTLINDLLTFARVTTKAQPFSNVDLGEITQEVLSDLETRLESSGGKVEITGPLPIVNADPTQVRQVLQNLIANALKFRRPDVAPIVRISANALPVDGQGRAMVEIAVADNGIGFDEKYLDRIFNVFQRLHGRNEFEGTGIGLAVARKIIERHEGSITAKSREGEGATFLFTLTLAST